MLGKSHMVVTAGVFNTVALTSYFSYVLEHSGTLEKVNPNHIQDMTGVMATFPHFLLYFVTNSFSSFLGLDWSQFAMYFNGYSIYGHKFSIGIIFHVLLLLGCVIIGSLSPDIDSEKSYMGRYIKPLSSWIPHRTITHTFWTVLVLSILSYFIKSYYFNAFLFGYVFHIVEDSFSKQGIAWFRPFYGYIKYNNGAVMKRGRHPKFFYYRTGSTVESAIRYVFFIINFILICLWVWIIGVGLQTL